MAKINKIITHFYHKLILTLNIKTFSKFVKMGRNNKRKKRLFELTTKLNKTINFTNCNSKITIKLL